MSKPNMEHFRVCVDGELLPDISPSLVHAFGVARIHVWNGKSVRIYKAVAIGNVEGGVPRYRKPEVWK